MISTQLHAVALLGERVEVGALLDRRTRDLASVSATATVDEQMIAKAHLTKSIVVHRSL